tara:strand:- start:2812 stop:3741 length:930 start_codon:yes stop_codon:yes gene_type:complete
MGKGSKQPQDQTVVQTNLPKYVKPYFERLLQRTEAESKQAYNPYTGQRLADETGDTLQSRQNIRDIASSGIAGLPQAQRATMAGMKRALQGLDYKSQDFDSAAAQKYMSPYMQNVVDVQKQKAIQDFQDQNAARAAQAVQAGAFGGSRQAIAQGMAQNELSRQLADIQATGQQAAFEQASGQFERDRAARESAERLGLTAGESLGAQGSQLAQLGQLAREGDIQAATLLEQIGKDQMAREQAGLDMAYEDFVRQRDYPREQLQFMSSILRGVPVQPSTETTKFGTYNPLQQLLGTGVSALGLYKGITGL